MAINPMKLLLDNISFLDTVQMNKSQWVHAHFFRFSYEFEFGKSYQLTSLNSDQNEALSYIVSGFAEPSNGSITLDGKPYLQGERRNNTWHVRYDEIKRFGRFYQPLKNQIRQGIRKNPQLGMTETDVKQHFGLTDARYGRLMKQFSHEGWSASCAIGYVHGKRIFCFPKMYAESVDTLRNRLINIVEFLKSQGCLILFPQLPYVNMDRIVDEVVHTHRKRNYLIGEKGTWIWKSIPDHDEIQLDNPQDRQKLIDIFGLLSNFDLQQETWGNDKLNVSNDLSFENVIQFLLEDTALSDNPFAHIGDILKFEYEAELIYQTTRLIQSLFHKIGKDKMPSIYTSHRDWRAVVEVSQDLYQTFQEEQ